MKAPRGGAAIITAPCMLPELGLTFQNGFFRSTPLASPQRLAKGADSIAPTAHQAPSSPHVESLVRRQKTRDHAHGGQVIYHTPNAPPAARTTARERSPRRHGAGHNGEPVSHALCSCPILELRSLSRKTLRALRLANAHACCSGFLRGAWQRTSSRDRSSQLRPGAATARKVADLPNPLIFWHFSSLEGLVHSPLDPSSKPARARGEPNPLA